MDNVCLPQRNQLTNQYQSKKFKNKHARSKWRHHSHKKYYKKRLSNKKSRAALTHLTMDYDDVLSESQQQLEDKFGNIDYFERPDKISTYKKRQQKYLVTKDKLIQFVSDVTSSEKSSDNCFLWDLQLQNHVQNCDGKFLDCKNWAIYKLKSKSYIELCRTFGEHFVTGIRAFSFSFHRYHFLSDDYYETLSKTYYMAQLKDTPTARSPSLNYKQQRKCIELKNMHCQLIFGRIYALAQTAINKTLLALYDSVPAFPAAVCNIIIDFMKPFPQIPPKPSNTFYDSWFHVRNDQFYMVSYPMKWYLSNIELLYPLEFNIGDSFGEACTRIIFDDGDVYRKFEFEDIGIETSDECLKTYLLKDVYHSYRPSYAYMTKFVLVCKLVQVEHNNDSLFMYVDFDEHGSKTIILSRFWMDLWSKIESDCIKADCYNNIKLSAKYGDGYDNCCKNEDGLAMDSEVNVVYEYD